jgi:hypothetical protein
MQGRAFAIGVAGILLCGCEDQAGVSKQASAVARSPKPLDAQAVAAALAAAKIPVVNVVNVTEAGDDNKLLGRPGQYTSKVFFYDDRHPKAADGDEGEKTIEVFSSAGDALRRRDYVAEMTKNMPTLTEYSYLKGLVLVRLDQTILPSEAKQYEMAVGGLR